MPIYALKCISCGKTIEYLGKHSDLNNIRCPECNEKMTLDYSKNTFSSTTSSPNCDNASACPTYSSGG